MLFNMSEEEWDAVIAVHLKGTFNCTRHAAVHMRQQRRGRIISISSTSGVYGNSGQANYGAAKDGIAGLTRVASRDLGRYGITVNAVCPGALTRMSQTVPPSVRRARAERGLATGFEERGFPLRNFGPENVAPWVVYLATGAAPAPPAGTVSQDGSGSDFLSGTESEDSSSRLASMRARRIRSMTVISVFIDIRLSSVPAQCSSGPASPLESTARWRAVVSTASEASFK